MEKIKKLVVSGGGLTTGFQMKLMTTKLSIEQKRKNKKL